MTLAQDTEKPVGLKTSPDKALFKVFTTDGRGELDIAGKPFDPRANCEYLERGGIIFFPQTPFVMKGQDREFLLTQKQLGADYHKNIAYRPQEDRITGVDKSSGTDSERLRRILRDYSNQVTTFLEGFLTPYTAHWHKDFASFRPIEEKGRKMRLRARNDLIHVDSFPTRPIFGNRIFRVFTNINPAQNRIWRTSDRFDVLATHFFDQLEPPGVSPLSFLADFPPFKALAKVLGFKANSPSAYDSWMLRFHNFLKEHAYFQETCRKDVWEFPPDSAWMVFTDVVSHSVLSGKYALEQTFIMSKDDLVVPEVAPINVLKRLYNLPTL